MDSDPVPSESIADASKPNAGRIYDYLLGGYHNFEVDRKAAEELKELMPMMPISFRLIRWFLSYAVSSLLSEGFTHFLDFASGLPTVDHIHVNAPEGTKIIYSDLDPVTVTYGKEITKGFPEVQYVKCDAGSPETLLDSSEVTELFHDTRKIAIGYNGILWFLPDERLSHAMNVLYEWAEKGSVLYLTTDDTAQSSQESEAATEFTDRYKKMSQELFVKSREKTAELCKPWVLRSPGFRTIEDWIEVESDYSRRVEKDWKGVGALYGAFFVKE